MTNVAEIPTSPRAQAYRITLGIIEYQITQRYCNALQSWYVNIDLADGTPKVRGLMLVTGEDLLTQLKHLGIEGELVVQSDNDPDQVPTYETLGVTGHLYFLTP